MNTIFVKWTTMTINLFIALIVGIMFLNGPTRGMLGSEVGFTRLTGIILLLAIVNSLVLFVQEER